MPKESPWHSVKANVHHNNTECDIGKDIEKEDFRHGHGDRPLCQECAVLNSLGR